MQDRAVDRRGFKRLPVSLKVVEEHAGGRTEAESLDICELGMRYVLPATAPRCRDREVMLEFRLPGDATPVQIMGWIAGEEVRADDRFVSVTFAFQTDRDASRLSTLSV